MEITPSRIRSGAQCAPFLVYVEQFLQGTSWMQSPGYNLVLNKSEQIQSHARML
jgi:hypothetical protein